MELTQKLALAQKVALNWKHLGECTQLEAFGSGWVNWTFKAQLGPHAVILQKLHPIFTSEVHKDIQAVTSHLHCNDFLVPHLITTQENKLCVENESGCWRMQNYLNGHCYETLASSNMANRAGQKVGMLHASTQNFEHKYFFSRVEAHNTTLYLERLKNALLTHREHRLYPDVKELSDQVFAHSTSLPALWSLPLRHSHGDLKASNLLWNSQDQCISIIDWDTVGLLPWPMELGDALRSWCNVKGEDAGDVNFDRNIFAAALEGYAPHAGHLWTKREKECLVDGLLVICLELSARFLSDALSESYFSFDDKKFATRGEHNLARAQAQWRLYKNIFNQADNLRALATKAFDG